jgi:hypothetical protein
MIQLTVGAAVIGTYSHSLGVFLGYGYNDNYGHFLDYDIGAFVLCPLMFYEPYDLPIECEICGMPLDFDIPVLTSVCAECDDYIAGLHYDG